MAATPTPSVTEPSVAEILRDPIFQELLRADGVEEDHVTSIASGAAQRIRQVRRSGGDRTRG